MQLENLAVKHNTFGEGVILSQNGKYFTVRFATATKIFVYPDAFEKFLTFADAAMPEALNADIAASRASKEKIRKEKQDENMRAMVKGIVIPGKEIVAETKDEEQHEETEEM